MKFKTGNSREQVQIFCLESYIHAENIVRYIDLFVGALPLKDYGFKVKASLPKRTSGSGGKKQTANGAK